MAQLLPRRAGRRTNVGLLALLLVAGGTGVLAFAVGSPGPARLVVAAHGAAGLGLLLLVPWKAVVVRRARRRPGGSGGVSLGVATLVTLLTGVLHAVGVTGPWSWSAGVPVLHLHVAAGVGTGALVVVHAWGRRQRPRATDLDRRGLLRAGGLAAGAVALWGAGEGLLRLTGAPGAGRRVTGSFERGTDDPAAMPVTQWISDPVPDSPAPVLELVSGGRRVRVPMGGLDRGDTVRAVLDCTGGWYAAQDWRGVRLDRLLASVDLELPAGGSVDVVSVTGFRRRLPLSEAGGLLLATHAAGRPLSAGHGAPVRLVVPGRRGFWWVKWVARVEVVDAPWWLQPPFPLQ
ncbi:molybdopterin-dependent oxidoreductase [Geodermatophilus sp. DSM 45219]|uniref:molybdopterin-dependent oxidoreductase n=1 Tax=Geodermatophilus sp. DSM 45219 TaxID=1881103 RepID=UPI0008923464|nr:molybdopterin-dependent oxidoreductase [Geodermatophilus sp. DSM 45219]SDO57650.1 DMSO/TMAO reductase YedYZ, molybdopterin-dependent catalytic subunit [Geodermatophilus sp. DSM 45219]